MRKVARKARKARNKSSSTLNRNALVAAPSCRVSRAALPFAETAWSQGEGCRGATSISPLWLSVSCSSFVLGLSDGFVSRDRGRKRARAGPLVSDCPSPFSVPLIPLFLPRNRVCRHFHIQSRPLAASPPEPAAPSYRCCCSTGHPNQSIRQSIASHLRNTPAFRSATRRHADTRIPLDVIAHILFLAIRSPETAPNPPGVACPPTNIPVPLSTPTATDRESGSLSCTHGRHGALLHQDPRPGRRCATAWLVAGSAHTTPGHDDPQGRRHDVSPARPPLLPVC